MSYVGSKTKDLVWSPDLNQVQPNTVGYEAVKGTRPFTDWNVVTTRANDPRSRYDGLGLELNKRLSAGLSMNGSYTLARHLSDAGGAVPTVFAAENGATTLDLYRGDADYGNVAFTRRHRFVSTFLYELPFGRNRRFGNGIGRGLDLLVGGWDVTGVTLLQSGPFLTPSFSNGDPVGHGYHDPRLHRHAAPGSDRRWHTRGSHCRTVLRFHGICPALGQHRAFRQRGRRHSGRSWHPGLLHDPREVVRDRPFRLRVEMAFSNLFNIENLDVPGSLNITSSAFGRITGTQTVDQAGPRTIQFSLRYSF